MCTELRTIWFELKSKYGEVYGKAKVYVKLEDNSFDHEFGTCESFSVRLDEIEELIVEGNKIDYDKLKEENKSRLFYCIDERVAWTIDSVDVESSLKESRVF